MKKAIINIGAVAVLSSTVLLADFDNFTDWGNAPSVTTSGDAPSSVVLESFAGFEAGRKNGAPSIVSAQLIKGEFHTLESDNDVIIVSSPVEFPQRLNSKQTIKLTLGSCPLATGASVEFGIISDKLKRNEFMTYRFEAAERPLCIKFNGNTIYHRNIADGRVDQKVFIPYFFFTDKENVLEITNEGNLALAFDYFRVQLASEGQKTFIAFDSEQSLPKGMQASLPIELVELSLPTNQLDNVAFLGNATPPQDFEAAYAAMNEFFTLGYTRDKKYGEEFNSWAAKLSQVLKGKRIPYVRIKGDLTKANEKTAMWFFTRFGNIVYGWICDDERSAEILSKYISGVNVVAVDVRDVAKVKTAANAENTYTRTYASPVTTKGGRQDRAYGDFMQQYLVAGKNFSPSFIPYLSPIKPLINKQAVIDNGEDTMVALLQVLMHGGRGAIIDPGAGGKNILLEGKNQPILSLYQKLFEICNGDGIMMPMALLLENHKIGNPLEDCYYLAVKNNEEEVTVFVFAGRTDAGRDARAIVPVPWSGAVTITHQDFYIDEIGQEAPTPNKPVVKNIKVLSPPRKKGVDIGSLKGVVSYEFKTSGLSIIKLKRYKAKIETSKNVAKEKSSTKPKTLPRAEVYSAFPNNFKYVPIVSATNISELSSFAKDKVSVYGPKGTGVISVKPSMVEALTCVSAPASFDVKGANFVMRNTPIWDDNSIFVEFSGASRKQRPGYILNLGLDEYLKGAKGFIFFANAEPIVSSVSERLAASSKPITFAIGSRTNQLLFDVNVGKPTLVYVPYSSIKGVMNDPSIVYLMMDTKEVRDVRLELNYLCAAHSIEGAESKLAVRYDLYEKALYVLVEGDTGKPLNVTFRLKDKYTLTKASPIMPHGFTNVKLNMDVDHNKYNIAIDKLPNNDGKKGDVSKYFPAISGEAPSGRTRVLIKFAAER